MSSNFNRYSKLEYLINGSLYHYNICNNIIKFYIPLPFFFTKDIGLSLPILLLQHNQVVIHINFKSDTSILKLNNNTTIINRPEIENVKLLCDYIFLHTNEKKCFYKSTKDYIIEQIQYSPNNEFLSNVPLVNIDLNFNHPCKELVWICQDNWNLVQNAISPEFGEYNPFCYSAGNNFDNSCIKTGGDIINNVELLLNNVKRFKKRHSSYFKIVQAYQHHEGLFYNNKLNNEERGYIYSYSFALNPDNSEPSGTCNFSRVSNAKLILSINNKLIQGNKFYIRVFAVNYNVLHFENGMGFLIYK